MQSTDILLPVAAMVFLVFLVFFATIISRVTQMNRDRIHPQQVNTRAEMAARVKDSRASDHLANLFEAPVLFYLACIVIVLLDTIDTAYLWLAWLFVAFRYLQALVHLTFNNVRTRAAVFGLGVATGIVIWARLVLDLWSL
ncbi:MAG: MAPEG family protein [Pseudomonadota bacterium]